MYRFALRPLPFRLGMGLSGLLAVVSVTLWWTGRADGRVHVIIPALRGDGLLVRAGSGQVALIDGGRDGAPVARWLGEELPLGRRRIDVLVLTRADRETLPGQVAAAQRWTIGQALLVAPLHEEPLWDELLRLLRQQGTPVRIARRGDSVAMGGDGDERVRLSVTRVDAGHGLVDLHAGHRRISLLQSLKGTVQSAIVEGPPADAVIYPWRRGAERIEIAALRPAVVVYGEGGGRDPRRTWAERQVASARLLHEAVNGRIELVLDGRGMAVEVERGD